MSGSNWYQTSFSSTTRIGGSICSVLGVRSRRIPTGSRTRCARPDVTGRAYPPFKFTIVEGSLLSAQRVELLAQLQQLRAAGMIDMITFYEKVDKLMNVKFDAAKIQERLVKEHQMGIMAMPPKKGGSERSKWRNKR